MQLLKGKVALITGGTAGIGKAIACLYAEHGADVVILGTHQERADLALREIDACKADPSQKTAAYLVNVSKSKEVEEFFDKFIKEWGKVDILVNNAGGAFGLDRAQEADLDEWEQCISVNINGLIYCTHSAVAQMVKRNRGHIINLGSVAGSYPYAGASVYCASKAFVNQFSLSLRSDLLGTSVRVSCIEPGIVEGTEFSVTRFRGDQAKAKSVYEKTTALQPKDIAESIYYCASLPPHVNVNVMEVMPVTQAPAGLSVHRKSP